MTSRAKLARKMRENGLTYKQIGEVLGISKQAAHQICNPKPAKNWVHEKTVQRVRYVGLRNWLLKNRVSVEKLSQLCNKSRFNKSLYGDTEPGKGTIDAILKVTGLTYEECFKEDE